jgi:hypothetical protein
VLLDEPTERQDSLLEVRDIACVEIGEAEETGNVSDVFWGRPRMEECAFGVGSKIALPG